VSIDAVIRVSRLDQQILARITHRNSRNALLEQIVQSRRTDSFLKGCVQTSSQSVKKPHNGCRSCLDDRRRHKLGGGIQNDHGDRCLVNIQANKRSVIHEKVLLSLDVDARDQNLIQRAALL
jgi:hypothetical protein